MIAFIHPLPPAPPAYVQVQAPNAGAPGGSDAGASAAPPKGRVAAKSDNGGQLASKAVPGGTNKAPTVGTKPPSFSAPAKQ